MAYTDNGSRNLVNEDDNPEGRDSEKRDPTLDGPTEQELADRADMLDKLGQSLAKTRSEAIEARSLSGIESEWIEDQEHYEGIDDANRGEMSAWRSKPLGQAALQGDDDDETGSTVFFNITRSYCDSASARVGDMLLPTDDRGWAIDPTPIPDMIAVAGGNIPPRIQRQIEEAVPEDQREAMIEQIIAQEKEIMERAKETAKKATTRIDDWHTECQYNAEMRKVIESASQVGTGVMKGPIPESRRHRAFVDNQLIFKETLQPISRKVDVFNCFPDPSCGQSIHNGSHHWERDDLTERDVIDLLDQPGYLRDQLRKVLTDGPHEATKDFREGDGGRADQLGLVKRDKRNLYEIWYFYGRVKKEDMEAAGVPIDMDDELKLDAHIVMINNRVIRASMNHLSSGEFPYDYMPWQERSGLPWGMGVARQIRTPQRVINGAGRNLMDNAGLAGGPMWIFNQGMVEPIDGIYEIAPRKGWFVSEDAESAFDVASAFTYIGMDMMQTDLQAIIQLGMRMAEDISGLPSLLQGQQGENVETLGATQLRQNNGSTTLRRIARLYDDRITTPHIRRYHDYLLEYGEDDEKGEFVIKARGSSALVERDLQNQSILDMAQLVSDPSFGLDKKKWARQYLMSQRLDPANFEFDDDDWQKVLEQLSAPPPDSSMQIAQLKIAFEELKLDQSGKLEVAKLQYDGQQKERDRMIEMAFKQLDQQLDIRIEEAKLAGSKDTGLDKIKSDLAQTVITLKTQIQMSKEGAAEQVADPIVEPVGRAKDGKAFEE